MELNIFLENGSPGKGIVHDMKDAIQIFSFLKQMSY